MFHRSRHREKKVLLRQLCERTRDEGFFSPMEIPQVCCNHNQYAVPLDWRLSPLTQCDGDGGILARELVIKTLMCLYRNWLLSGLCGPCDSGITCSLKGNCKGFKHDWLVLLLPCTPLSLSSRLTPSLTVSQALVDS